MWLNVFDLAVKVIHVVAAEVATSDDVEQRQQPTLQRKIEEDIASTTWAGTLAAARVDDALSRDALRCARDIKRGLTV